jgi:hypothetical protein
MRSVPPPRGPCVAGPPLVAAGDPEGIRAAWRGVGRRVAELRMAEPQRIPTDLLWPRPHVVTGAPLRSCFQQRRKVLDEMPRRGTAARDDLAGGGLHDAWASGQNGVTSGKLLGCWARWGARPGRCPSREAIAGVGAAASTRRRCWEPKSVRGACATACAGKCARARRPPCPVERLVAIGVTGRRHGGAWLVAMGGGVRGVLGGPACT